jgi:hypothetical protein
LIHLKPRIFNILDGSILAFSCRRFSLPKELQAIVFKGERNGALK